MNTANLGLPLIPSTVPNAGGDADVILTNAVSAALDAQCGATTAAADGAITATQGLVVITKASAAAVLTLALPTAGLPSTGGDDGKKLTVFSKTAKAHTITTPAAGLNGASTTLTFTAAVGNFVELTAYAGTWLVRGSTGATIS